MSDQQPGVSTPSTAYLDLIEAETARRAKRSGPITSDFTGAPESTTTVLAALVEDLSEDLAHIVHELHAHPETAFEEVGSAQVLAKVLESHGLEVTVGVHGLETAVRAEVTSAGFDESRHRTIAVLGEYDALPEVGHACGHNVIAATAVGAVVALKRLLEQDAGAFEGRVVFLGTPAEEGHTGKEYLAREGAFDGLAAAIMVHPYGEDVAEQVWLGRRVLTATYSGVSAHASAQPFMGRNALDAATLAYQGIGLLRQQLPPVDRVHAILTEGGARPSMIPQTARLELYVRSQYPETLKDLSARLDELLRGAAMMAGAGVEVDWDPHPPSLPVRSSGPLTERWALTQQARGRSPLPAGVISESIAASTDFGNVSYRVPGIHPLIKIAHLSTALHTEAFAAAAASPEAERAALDGAYGLAATALDLLVDDDLARAVKEDFDDAGGAIDVAHYFE
ncbi:MAG: M20 family metallopeptidase [Nocardioides sp.]